MLYQGKTAERRDTMGEICEDLLTKWCDSLLRLQIKGTGEKRLDGAILCPACGKIHGRCGEVMYPFLKMAKLKKDKKWVDAAKAAFQWEEYTVSQPDGSLLNDIDSEWKGITVFFSIQLADCLKFGEDLLDEETKIAWKDRLKRAADFLCEYEDLVNNNVNYPLVEALALYEAWEVLGEERYLNIAKKRADLFEHFITEDGILFGEGVPKDRKSLKGCCPVDIGYNIEETLPSLVLYAQLSGDEKIQKLAEKGMCRHLDFMLDNGMWDNSFGTRNYKWTCWGSRTSDGCGFGYLLLASKYPKFAEAALKNLKYLAKCTEDGLLAGGPHYKEAGQPICVHHTFTHAKMLAWILDWKLEGLLNQAEEKTREEKIEKETRFYPDLAVWSVKMPDYRATVTGYDWEYVPAGHVTGGTLSLLWHRKAGLLLCASPRAYVLKEPNNMQIPYRVHHECLALRIEADVNGETYSSMSEDQAEIHSMENQIKVRGKLKNMDNKEPEGHSIAYCMTYHFEEDCVICEAEFEEGKLICPVISCSKEPILKKPDASGIMIHKISEDGQEKLTTDIEIQGDWEMPYEEERIFFLTPGLQALRLDVKPVEHKVQIAFRVTESCYI